MKKYSIGIGILALALALIGAYGLTRPADIASARVDAPLVAERTHHDFGAIDIFGGVVKTTYTLRNEGDADIIIHSAVTSCMCTEGEIGGLHFGMHETSGETVTIPPGEAKILTATFDPLAHGPEGTGAIRRELMLKTNSTETPEVVVTFGGNVVKNEE